MACRICGSDGVSKTLIAKEMMFGLRDEFEYFACDICGCLQISAIPSDLERYYQSNDYYSFSGTHIQENPLRRWLINRYWHYKLERRDIIGYLINLAVHTEELPICFLCDMGRNSNILDIGCGAGTLLRQMSSIGYKRLTGIDKYLPGSSGDGSIRLIKGEVRDLVDSFDVIMMHHSLEHIVDQHELMQSLRRLLSQHGKVLIRIPVLGQPFDVYQENWVGLDAPRHLYLHTIESFKYLTDANRFTINNILYDTGHLELLRSINYTRDIPLVEQLAATKGEVKRLRQQAKDLNANKTGCNACFILSKKQDDSA